MGVVFVMFHLFFQLERLHELTHVAYALALFIQLVTGGTDWQGQQTYHKKFQVSLASRAGLGLVV